MSLFKTEEFWSTKIGQGENYNSSALCVSKFLTSSPNSDQIITGSLNGYLRFFSSSVKNTNNSQNVDGDNPFSLVKSGNSMDITIEYYLKTPIIQLEAGKFCNDSQKSLAVLSPNKLSLFEIDEENMAFKIIEEYNLKRVAYNFCIGNFGQVSDREYICIQSTDTTLSFYVNGHLSFSCFLSDYLLPGPIQYLAMDDSIIIVNSNRYFEAYKYKSLAVLNSKNNELTVVKSQKLATADWNFNLGEDALEIKICDTVEQGSLILILCRFSLFILNGRNRTALKKRFECRCKLVVNYGVANGIEPRFLVSSGFNELMVFQNTTLKWKALMINPNVIDLQIGMFNGMEGFIVTLSETGNLAILYLGTDPSTNTVMMPSTREQINDNNEDELVKLQQKIKRITSNSASAPIAIKTPEASRSYLKVTVDHSSGSINSDGGCPEYSIKIRLKTSMEIKNIVVRISTHQPITAKNKLLHYSSLTPDRDVTCHLSFISNAAMVVCNLKVLVYVSYELTDNNFKISQTSFNLPLGLVVNKCPPCKQAKFKVTLDTNEDIVNLSRLFPEFPNTAGDELSNVAFAFQYYNDGPIVTILGSAAAKRYRIQSDHFEAIWLIMKELSSRLSQHFGKSFQIKYSDPLPLDSYFLVLDFHFSIRTNLRQLHQMLDERSKQFRAIEKLLLTKTKDKSLISLQNLDALLDNSINQLIQLSDLIVEQEQHLAIVGNALCSATSIISYILQITTCMPQSQQQLLQNALSGNFRDFADIGLEELYDQIFVFLLKSAMGPNKAGTEMKLSVLKLELPNNIDKLKKHIEMLCERVAKGVQLNVGDQSIVSPNDSSQFPDDRLDSVKKFVTAPHTKNKPKKSKKHKKIVME